MTHKSSRLAGLSLAFVFGLILMQPGAARAQYDNFNIPGAPDCTSVEWRQNTMTCNGTYDATWNGYLNSIEGASCYWYGGPAGLPFGANNSFWPISNPINPTDKIKFVITAPTGVWRMNNGEAFSGACGTYGPLFAKSVFTQTNVWYRLVMRYWLPADGTPHQSYLGQWDRDPVSGNWYHGAKAVLPFTINSMGGVNGWQEGTCFPKRSDLRNCYYHLNGTWNAANQVNVEYNNGVAYAGVIEDGTAFFYECYCADTGCSITNFPGANIDHTTTGWFTMTNQPALPTFDPIIVTNTGAWYAGGQQVAVQWQVPLTSSPQLSYRIDVFTNASYTGSPAVTFFDRDPDCRMKVVNIPGVATPYVRLTIADIFDNTNTPIAITPALLTLSAATNVTGAINGLGYKYYESATNYYWRTDGNNWTNLPNFDSLTPKRQGAVLFPDITPHLRHSGYAFNYTGFIQVPTNGLYTFTTFSMTGVQLYIDGALVVDANRDQNPMEVSGWVGLQAGTHTFNLQYFMNTQDAGMADYNGNLDVLKLYYTVPGQTVRTEVPLSAYWRVPGGAEPAITLTAPATGATLCTSTSAFAANVSANGATVNSVQYYLTDYYYNYNGQGIDYPLGQTTAAPYGWNSMVWAAPSNAVRARLVYNGSNTMDSAVVPYAATNMTLDPWQLTPLETHNYPSGAKIQGITYTLLGDAMNLLTRTVSGDCTLIAHLAGLPSGTTPDGVAPVSSWQGGIIMRGDLAANPGNPLGKNYAAMMGDVSGGIYYQDNTMISYGGAGHHSSNLGGANDWLKIQRVGSNFTSSVSPDGVNWAQVNTVNTTNLSGMGTALNVGFFTYALPSQNPNLHWAGFDGVSLVGNVSGAPSVSVTPQAQTLGVGQTAAFTSLVIGQPPFTYQWQVNGVNISGATNATLTVTNSQVGNSGLYQVVLTTGSGTAVSPAVTLTVLNSPSYLSSVLADQPAGYWRFGETNGSTAYDSSGNNNPGTYSNVTLNVAGAIVGDPDPAAGFNGSSSLVTIANPGNFNFPGTSAFTLETWVKFNSTSLQRFFYNGGYSFGLNSASQLIFTACGIADYTISIGAISTGKWYHIAVVRSGTQIQCYTNGVAAGGAVSVPSINSSSGALLLGTWSGSKQFVNGTMDEAAVYATALGGADILQHYQAGLTAWPSVTLTSPTNGAAYAAPAAVNCAAGVVTNGHTINYVQFYNGTNLVGVSSSAPYSFAWTNVGAGQFTVLAQLVYDTTNTLASAPAFITVVSPPAAPTNLVATAVSTNQINLNWSAVANADAYIVNRDGTPIVSVAGTSYADTGLETLVAYCYTVVATNWAGSSPTSALACATTLSPPPPSRWYDGTSNAGAGDGASAGLGGNWDTTTTNWDVGAGLAHVAWNNTANGGDNAVFGNLGNSTVTVTVGTVSTGNLTFTSGAGAGGNTRWSLTGGLLTLGTVNHTATIDASAMAATKEATAAVACVLAGNISSGLTLIGGSTINGVAYANNFNSLTTSPRVNCLGVSGANTFTGPITISNVVENAASGSRFISFGTASKNVTLSQGTLELFNQGTFTFDHNLIVDGINNAVATHNTSSFYALSGNLSSKNGSSDVFWSLARTAPSALIYTGNLAGFAGTFYARGVATGTNLIDCPSTFGGTFYVDSGILQIGNGDTRGSLGTNNLVNNGTISYNRTDSLTYAAGISGTGALRVNSGTLALSGTNTYSGTTTHSGGTLLVNGSIGTNTVTVASGATLGGWGTIGGVVTVQAGGTLAPGAGGIGKLTLSKPPVLQGATVLELSKTGSNLTNDQLAVSAAITYGGTLTVTNIGTNALAAGDSFNLFNATGYAGSFTATNLPALGLNLAWNTTGLGSNGTIVVRSTLPLWPPAFTGGGWQGDNGFGLTATGGVNQYYILQTVSNLNLPMVWLSLLTNQADTNGVMNFLDIKATNQPQRFYRITTP